MYLQTLLLVSFFLLSLSNPSFSTDLDTLPDDVIPHITRSFTHKEIVYTFGRLTKRLNQLSQQDWTWRNTHITQKEGTDKCVEFDLLIAKLKQNPQLHIKSLYISVPKIFPSELNAFRLWLMPNMSLRSLSLVNCGLTQKSSPESEEYLFMSGIGKWLKTNSTLEELDLSGNPLAYSTAFITEALRKNRGLKRLILDSTYPQSDMYSETFEEDLAQNTTLRYFSFRNNRLPNLEWLNPILKRNEGLPPIEVDLTETTSASNW